jgi:cyanophycinase
MKRNFSGCELLSSSFLSFFLGLSLLGLAIPAAGQNSADKEGSLFIIGGGKLPDSLLNQMIDLAEVRYDGYVLILPMASENPDSVAQYFKGRLELLNVKAVVPMFIGQQSIATNAQIDSVIRAKLIFMTGGDQNRLMNAMEQLTLTQAIRTAHTKGAMIAGTSAGAAVMSQFMLTGRQLLYPDDQSDFRHLKKGNVQLTNGLGLLKQTVIDQHFVERSRYNRLLSVVIERPDLMGIGISEGTAIWVVRNRAEVFGAAQVILVKNKKRKKPENGMLYSPNIRLTMLLSGARFSIR